MRANQKRPIFLIFLILFFGIVVGSILSQVAATIFPDGVVKDFFIMSKAIGWGAQENNWVDLDIIRFKTGFFVDVSVVSILGLAIAWYFLRYFR